MSAVPSLPGSGLTKPLKGATRDCTWTVTEARLRDSFAAPRLLAATAPSDATRKRRTRSWEDEPRSRARVVPRLRCGPKQLPVAVRSRAGTDRSSSAFRVGDYCDARFPTDKLWYPARVSSLTAQCTGCCSALGSCSCVQVTFVGYGNKETLAATALRSLSAVFRPWVEEHTASLSPAEGAASAKTPGRTTAEPTKPKECDTPEAKTGEAPRLSYTGATEHVMRKYWAQRYRLWTRFDEGIMMDHEAWYSVTPEVIATHIAQRCSCGVAVDAFTGAGANAIQLARTCHRVIAIDISPQRVALARHNARVYGVADKIDFIVGDFFALAPRLKADVVFLSPPWGGPKYLRAPVFRLEDVPLQPHDGVSLLDAALAISPHVAYFLPRNVDHQQVAKSMGRQSTVEIEEQFINDKLKCVTAYSGALAAAVSTRYAQ